MKSELVSVIVPVYNAEKTLKRCCVSLMKQSYKNIEILLVNDGSKDKSLNICRFFQKKDKRIKIIEKGNGGVSSARNAGLAEAVGKYICFADSDDYVEEDYILCLYEAVTKYNADICFSGYWIEKEKYRQRMQDTKQICFLEKEAFYQKMLDYKYGKYAMHYPYAKIFKRDIIQNNRLGFDEGISCGEDMLFNAIYYQQCRNMVIIPDCNYCYIMNEGSLSSKYNPGFEEDMKRVFEEYKKIFRDSSLVHEEQINELLIVLLRNIMFNFYSEKRTLQEGTEKLDKCRRNLGIDRRIGNIQCHNKSNRLIYFLICHRLNWILCMLFQSKKIIKKQFFPLFCFVRRLV